LLKGNNINKELLDIEKSLEQDPANVHTLIKLGGMYIESHDPDKAFLHLQKAVRIAPDFAAAWNALFSACQHTDQLADMVKYCDIAINAYPGNTLAWSYQGYAYEQLHQYDRALAAYKRATDLTKERYDLWDRMGSINAKLDRQEETLACLQMALKYGSNNTHTHLNYAKIQRAMGGDTECEKHCRRALEISPDYPPALIELGMVLIDRGQYEAAINYFNQARNTDPGNTEIASGLAQAYDRMGKHDEAYEAIRPLLESGQKDPGIACTYAKISANTGNTGDAIRVIEDILENSHPALYQRIDLHFMAGLLYDKAGEFSRAMHHFNSANSLKPTNFDPDGYARFIDNMINSFSNEAFERLPSSGCSDERPVFIVGVMRSGTSLAEQILASHGDVYGCGELMGITLAAREIGLYQHIIDMDESLDQLLTQEKLESLSQEYLEKLPPEALSAQRFTDKMPNNFLNLGLIALLFPKARVIHIKRNPLDTCLSAYFINFAGRHDYAYSLVNLGFHYRQYQKLMGHWRETLPLEILDIEYEDLVKDTEKTCRSIIDFCNLEWDEKVMDFHTSERLINTASYNQVRNPIYTSSIGHWKNYEEYLEPLKRTLEI
jgi:tetratricopeptide (TPR) repeat protein